MKKSYERTSYNLFFKKIPLKPVFIFLGHTVRDLLNLAAFLFHFTLGTTVSPTGPRQVESEFATIVTVVSLRRLLVDPP